MGRYRGAARVLALASALLGLLSITQAATPLQSGQFVSGYIGASNQHEYYTFRPTALYQPIDIAVKISRCVTSWSNCEMAIVVDYRPYVSTSNATWRGYASPKGEVRIDASDRWSGQYTCEQRNIPLDQCIYYVAVYSYNTNTSYSIAAAQPAQGLNELRSGITRSGTLAANQFEYMYLSNGNMEDFLIFALTADAGDVDLYISTRTTRPGPNDYEWSSAAVGDDVVILNTTSHMNVYYYIAVYNYLSNGNSSYSLIAAAYADDPDRSSWYLEPDRAQKDYALSNTYRYYYMYVEGIWPKVSVTLDSLMGDADIFVNQMSGWPWRWPNRTHSHWNSTTSSRDQVNITYPESGSYLLIAVYNKLSTPARYSIVISGENRITVLAPYGSVIENSVATSDNHYYSITVPEWYSVAALNSMTLTIMLKSLSGDPDLRVSDTYMRPNGTAPFFNWTSSLAGSSMDVIHLDGDVTTTWGRRELHTGNYYVAVLGYTAARYQISALLRQRQYVRPNSPLSLYMNAGLIQYLEMDFAQGQNFTITTHLTNHKAYNGTLSIYVSATVEPNPDVASTYFARFLGSGHQQTQSLRVTPPASACSSSVCHYYIAVVRPKQALSTDYAPYGLLVESAGAARRSLPNGQPIEVASRTSDPGFYTVFDTFEFDLQCAQSNVSIIMTQIGSGSLGSIFVNRGPLPPLNAFENDEFGARETITTGAYTKVFRLDWRHPSIAGQSMKGKWFLTTTSYSPFNAYTLMLNARDGNCDASSSPALTALTPVTISTAVNGYSVFQYVSPNTNTVAWPYSVHFTLTSAVNSTASLAPFHLLARSDGNTPSMGYAQYQSLDGSGVLSITQNTEGVCVPDRTAGCFYTLAVHSLITSTVTVTASLRQTVYGMSTNTEMTTTVTNGQSKHFAAAVPANGASSLSLVVDPCWGSVDVSMNYKNATVPSMASKDLSLANVNKLATQVIPHSTASAAQLIVTVDGKGTSASSYRLVALTNATWADAAPYTVNASLKANPYGLTTLGHIRARLTSAAQIPRAVTSTQLKPPAANAQSILKYSIYLIPKTEIGTINLESVCALQQRAVLVAILTAQQLQSAANWVDVMAPRQRTLYSLIVLVQHVWRLNGVDQPSSPAYLAYNVLGNVQGGTVDPNAPESSTGGDEGEGGSGESGSSSTTTFLLILLGGIIFVVLMGLVYWWHSKNNKAAETASNIEPFFRSMNDASDSTSAIEPMSIDTHTLASDTSAVNHF